MAPPHKKPDPDTSSPSRHPQMSKAKRKRPEDEASDGTRASPRTRGVSGAGGASATRPDGGADGGVKKEPGDDDSAGASPGRARHRE